LSQLGHRRAALETGWPAHPHQSFGWQWSRHGEVVASICVCTETDRVILTYRHRSGGEDWKDESYPVYLDCTACHLGGQRPWFLCRPSAAVAEWRSFMSAVSSPVVTATGWPTSASAKPGMTGRKGQLTEFGTPGILNGNGWQPNGMHWSIFERLTAQHDAFVQVSLAGMAAKLNLLGESIESWI